MILCMYTFHFSIEGLHRPYQDTYIHTCTCIHTYIHACNHSLVHTYVYTSKRSLMVSTSFLKVDRISLSCLIIVALIASRERMCLKFCIISNAPSAERRDWNESSMNWFASCSIIFTSCWNRFILLVQFCRWPGSKGSKRTVSMSSIRRLTFCNTASIPSGFPVTAFNSGPKILRNSSIILEERGKVYPLPICVATIIYVLFNKVHVYTFTCVVYTCTCIE